MFCTDEARKEEEKLIEGAKDGGEHTKYLCDISLEFGICTLGRQYCSQRRITTRNFAAASTSAF